jgi:hypothetical protein
VIWTEKTHNGLIALDEISSRSGLGEYADVRVIAKDCGTTAREVHALLRRGLEKGFLEQPEGDKRRYRLTRRGLATALSWWVMQWQEGCIRMGDWALRRPITRHARAIERACFSIALPSLALGGFALDAKARDVAARIEAGEYDEPIPLDDAPDPRWADEGDSDDE